MTAYRSGPWISPGVIAHGLWEMAWYRLTGEPWVLSEAGRRLVEQ